MLGDRLAAQILEEERSLLHARVHLTVDENPGVNITLCRITENLILRHDALVHLVDELEALICGVFVAEDLIGHGGPVGRVWDEALDEEEVGALRHRQLLLSRDMWTRVSEGYSRDIVRDVREVVSWCNNQTKLPLLGLCGHIVDDVASPRLHVVSL